MARPLEFNKEDVLKKALDVFWLKGYEASSLADLLAAMGISKSSFYQSFGSKCDLFKSCLQLYTEESAKHLNKKLTQHKNMRKNLEDLLKSVYDEGCQRGCFFVNVATEFSQTDPCIAATVQKGFCNFENAICETIQRGQEMGDISNPPSAKNLAKLFFNVYSGLRTSVKSGASKKEMDMTIKTFFDLF